MCGVSESEYEERFLKDEPVENGKFNLLELFPKCRQEQSERNKNQEALNVMAEIIGKLVKRNEIKLGIKIQLVQGRGIRGHYNQADCQSVKIQPKLVPLRQFIFETENLQYDKKRNNSNICGKCIDTQYSEIRHFYPPGTRVCFLKSISV